MSGNFTWKPSPLSSTIIFWLARESACFSLKCPPHTLYFMVLLGKKADLSIAMYVTLTNIQNGEPVSVPGTACGGLEVALCELTYYHRWLSISAELENGIFDGCTVLGIPKGYYNVCELDKEVFRPLGAELSLHAPTSHLQISSKKRLVLDRGLVDLLGFSREFSEPGQSHTADKPHRLFIHREICVHLAEVSMSENLHNSRPSILLKSIPVKNKRCGGGWTETFPVLQYKQLASEPLSQLTLTILDMGGRKLGSDYLSAVLHTRRNGGRGWPRECQEMH